MTNQSGRGAVRHPPRGLHRRLPPVRVIIEVSLVVVIVTLFSGVGGAFAGVGRASETPPHGAVVGAAPRPAQPAEPISTATTAPPTTVTAVPAPPTTTIPPPPPTVVRRAAAVPTTNPRPPAMPVISRAPTARPAPTPTTTPGPAAPAAPTSQPSRPGDPPRSIPPSSDFFTYCFSSSYSQSACDNAAMKDINSALAGEGYGPLPLPSNYNSLSIVPQLVAVANAERAVRGLPQMPENSNLDAMAYNGARNNTDPTGPPGYTWGSNIAMGYPTALSADYVWMYDDGTNSPNIDCQSAGDSGCWGHRHNILIQGGGEAGAGMYNYNGAPNLTQLFVVNYP